MWEKIEDFLSNSVAMDNIVFRSIRGALFTVLLMLRPTRAGEPLTMSLDDVEKATEDKDSKLWFMTVGSYNNDGTKKHYASLKTEASKGQPVLCIVDRHMTLLRQFINLRMDKILAANGQVFCKFKGTKEVSKKASEIIRDGFSVLGNPRALTTSLLRKSMWSISMRELTSHMGIAQLIASQARHLTKTGLTHYNLVTDEDLIFARAMMEVLKKCWDELPKETKQKYCVGYEFPQSKLEPSSDSNDASTDEEVSSTRSSKRKRYD